MEIVLPSNVVLEFHYLYCEAGAWFNIKQLLPLAYNIITTPRLSYVLLNEFHGYLLL
jgi:hypothetical protein